MVDLHVFMIHNVIMGGGWLKNGSLSMMFLVNSPLVIFEVSLNVKKFCTIFQNFLNASL